AITLINAHEDRTGQQSPARRGGLGSTLFRGRLFQGLQAHGSRSIPGRGLRRIDIRRPGPQELARAGPNLDLRESAGGRVRTQADAPLPGEVQRVYIIDYHLVVDDNLIPVATNLQYGLVQNVILKTKRRLSDCRPGILIKTGEVSSAVAGMKFEAIPIEPSAM